MFRLFKSFDRTLLLASVAVLCLVCAPAYATSLAADSGNTQPISAVPGGVDGTVDFAVYTNCVSTGCTAADPFGVGGAIGAQFVAGTGSGAFSSSSKYLYLYETVDNGANTLGISSNTVALSLPSLATSFGYFSTWAFTAAVLGSPAGFVSPISPASTGATPAVNNTQSGLTSPTTVALGSSSIVATYGTNIPNGGMSVLWGFTSNNPPVFLTTSIQDGGTSGIGTAPTPSVPEASTVFLTGAGGILLGLASFLRRRQARKV